MIFDVSCRKQIPNWEARYKMIYLVRIRKTISERIREKNEKRKNKTLIEELEVKLYNISQEKLLVAVESKGERHVRCINGLFL